MKLSLDMDGSGAVIIIISSILVYGIIKLISIYWGAA